MYAIFAICTVIALVVWLLFYLLRGREKLGKYENEVEDQKTLITKIEAAQKRGDKIDAINDANIDKRLRDENKIDS
jgi:hypothetical protein